MTLYDELAALTEGAAAAANAGRFEHVTELQQRLDAIMAELPAAAPATAGTALRRAAAANADLEQTLRTEMAATGHQLTRLRNGRRAMAGYSPAATRVHVDARG